MPNSPDLKLANYISNMQIINYPLTGYRKEDYYQLYDKVVDSLKHNSDVKCICTFGGVNQPGISDIDLLITFKKDSTFSGDIVSNLSAKEKALFTHGIMALSEEHWFQNKAYAMWDNQKLLVGQEPKGDGILVSESELIAKAYANDWAAAITSTVWAGENESYLINQADLIKTEVY